jgi:hypothetical protein
VPAAEVIEDRPVVGGKERLFQALAALHLRQLADASDELVGAGGRVAGLPRLHADEAIREEIRSSTEEGAEEPELLFRCRRDLARAIRPNRDRELRRSRLRE